jgi:hypothetical protein
MTCFLFFSWKLKSYKAALELFSEGVFYLLFHPFIQLFTTLNPKCCSGVYSAISDVFILSRLVSTTNTTRKLNRRSLYFSYSNMRTNYSVLKSSIDYFLLQQIQQPRGFRKPSILNPKPLIIVITPHVRRNHRYEQVLLCDVEEAHWVGSCLQPCLQAQVI